MKPLNTEIGHPDNQVLLVPHVIAKTAEFLTVGNATRRDRRVMKKISRQKSRLPQKESEMAIYEAKPVLMF
jgi:hypothetical protein